MLESKLFLSKLNILYAVFKGTFLSSNITERLSPFFTSWICLFLIKGKPIVRSFEIVISSTFCGFSAVKSIYINRLNDRIIRVDLDAGYVEDRRKGRGYGGYQWRDTLRENEDD